MLLAAAGDVPAGVVTAACASRDGGGRGYGEDAGL